MNLISTKQLTDKAVEACAKAIEDGWKIVPSWFGSLDKRCCCPLTAIALTQTEDFWDRQGDEVIVDIDLLWPILEKQGIGEDESSCFYEGFDTAAQDATPDSGRWFQAGYETYRILKERGMI